MSVLLLDQWWVGPEDHGQPRGADWEIAYDTGAAYADPSLAGVEAIARRPPLDDTGEHVEVRIVSVAAWPWVLVRLL